MVLWRRFEKLIKNSKGESVTKIITLHPTDSKATCWCAIGAIIKVSPEDNTVRDEAREFCLKRYGITLADMNDLHGRKKVITIIQDYISNLGNE